MAADTVITLIGNLTDNPELRFTPAGTPVANFTVASTPRVFDRNANEWNDGETLFLRCTIWREAAENVAESLIRGARVIVSGKLKQRSYQNREGQTRTVVELDVDELGPSLRYATAKVTRTTRSTNGWSGPDATQSTAPPSDDPWGQPAMARATTPAMAGAVDDEPPF